MTTYTVEDVLGWLKSLGGRLVNESDVHGVLIQVVRPAELARSTERELAFFFSKNYQADLMTAAAGILVTGEPFIAPLKASGLPLWKRTAVIACADPYLAMALCMEKFAPGLSSAVHPAKSSGSKSLQEIHPAAIVSPSARLGDGVQIGAYCVIEDHAQIGARTFIYPGSYVGRDAVVGEDCVLFAGAKLYEQTVIGSRVRIHSGAVLGADGFGYAPSPTGHRKIFHLGRVVVGDDVEIGANTCVDRGTLGDTRIDRQAKIDDLVMIGHNCWIGEGAIICGKAGLAGRARVGKYAMVGGAAGLCNDVHVGDGAKVAAHCLVSKDVPEGVTVVGNPQREHKEHFRIQAMLNRMAAKRGEPTDKKLKET